MGKKASSCRFKGKTQVFVKIVVSGMFTAVVDVKKIEDTHAVILVLVLHKVLNEVKHFHHF
ncbi:MAG: hypothetical protein RLZZ77_139 [Bacteroidota bacterium]